MRLQPEATDTLLSEALTALSRTRNDYWSFHGNAQRSYCHNYFQYPAMMVPDMLGDLMTTVVETDENVKTIYDPFAGSGTVLTETMLLGREFTGVDINPLAILLCKAKSGPFRYEYLSDIVDEVCERIWEDKSTRLEADFANRNKWFEPEISVQLSRIRRSIRTVTDLWCRRFLWVALAETVRLTSNSRTSTFKLHIRPHLEIKSRQLDPRETFEEVVTRNLDSMEEFHDALGQKELLHRGSYRHSIKVSLKSAASCHGPLPEKADLLVTSPPYGDNTTTVAEPACNRHPDERRFHRE
jgi:adenine-specific DNA methylase